MKIIDAYTAFSLYEQCKEAVTTVLERNGLDPRNNDLFLAVCELMEADATEYPIFDVNDCSDCLELAAEKAVQHIRSHLDA